jgi:hypothetical protein
MGKCQECGKEIFRFVNVKVKRRKGEPPIEILGTTRGPKIKFCNTICHNNYHNRKRTKATHPEIKCIVCDTAIIQRNIEQRFCSTKCRMAYWKERQTPILKSRDLFA